MSYLFEVAVVGANEGDGVLVGSHDSYGGDRGLVHTEDGRRLHRLGARYGVIEVMDTTVVVTNGECLANRDTVRFKLGRLTRSTSMQY